MNPTANPYPLPKSSVWSLALDSVRQMFRPFGPLFPRNPFFPALRSGLRLLQRPSPQKQIPSSHKAHWRHNTRDRSPATRRLHPSEIQKRLPPHGFPNGLCLKMRSLAMDQKKDTLGKMPVSPSVPLLTNGDLWLV